MSKDWYTSKVLLVNIALILVAGIGLVMDAASVLELSGRAVAVLGIVAGVINAGLRLYTSQPVRGSAGEAQARRRGRP